MLEESEANSNDNSDNDESNNELVGKGLVGIKKRRREEDKFEEEQNIRRAMPEMENTLGNWTLHGQNLGKMLKNYKRQYRHLPPDHRRELGQFFNMTSAVLDTIGSMTENSILRFIQFNRPGLSSGGVDNAPQPMLRIRV